MRFSHPWQIQFKPGIERLLFLECRVGTAQQPVIWDEVAKETEIHLGSMGWLSFSSHVQDNKETNFTETRLTQTHKSLGQDRRVGSRSQKVVLFTVPRLPLRYLHTFLPLCENFIGYLKTNKQATVIILT